MGKTRPVDPFVAQYFAELSQPLHRQYLALRSFLFEGDTAEAVAAKYGYTVNTVYTIAKNFKARLTERLDHGADPFFQTMKPGRKKTDKNGELVKTILSYRKKQLSIPDIKIILDAKGIAVSEGFIYTVCDEDGFARLPKRSKWERQALMENSGYTTVLQAPVSEMCAFSESEQFSSN